MLRYFLVLVFYLTFVGYNLQALNHDGIPNKSYLPDPYNSVEILPFDARAHFGKNQAQALTRLITIKKVKTVVEIGSYLGASTRFIAKLLPEEGKVYAVDHWMGNSEWAQKPGFKEEQPLLYQKFLSNVIHEGLCEKIIPMKMTSLEASRILNVVPDLIFIDGSHDYESVYEDICAWYPFVESCGVLCGDDYGWGATKPVKRAVLRFAEEHNLRVKTVNDWVWYYER